jgi:CubicO group peptidase (beta-lactamase class C family)
VLRHGETVWRGAFAHNAWHNVFSCTKSFLSMATGLLIDDGTLALDTPLYTIVPDLEKDYPDMTPERCLSLTSGYAAIDPRRPWEPAAPLFKEGEAFHYGVGDAMNMLAYALTLAGGEPLDELFQHRVAEPLKIEGRWNWGDFGYFNGVRVNNGSGSFFKGMHINAENMARIGQMLLNNGERNGKQLLSKDWIARASRAQAPADLPMYDPKDWYSAIRGVYGLGFWTNGIRPDGKRIWPDAPENTFALQGLYNNICFVIPEWDMVLVRLGTDSLINTDLYNGVFAKLQTALS